jgi:hypothetical protein
MEHPSIIRPSDHAEWRSDRMGKTTLFQSRRAADSASTRSSRGSFTRSIRMRGWTRCTRSWKAQGWCCLDGRELPIKQGELVVAP